MIGDNMLIYDLTHEELVDFLLKNNQKKFRADQIWNWLYKQKVSSFKEIKQNCI